MINNPYLMSPLAPNNQLAMENLFCTLLAGIEKNKSAILQISYASSYLSRTKDDQAKKLIRMFSESTKKLLEDDSRFRLHAMMSILRAYPHVGSMVDVLVTRHLSELEEEIK